MWESTNRKSAIRRKKPGEAMRHPFTPPDTHTHTHTPQLHHVHPVQIILAVPAVSMITLHGTDSPRYIPQKKVILQKTSTVKAAFRSETVLEFKMSQNVYGTYFKASQLYRQTDMMMWWCLKCDFFLGNQKFLAGVNILGIACIHHWPLIRYLFSVSLSLSLTVSLLHAVPCGLSHTLTYIGIHLYIAYWFNYRQWWTEFQDS